MCKARNGAAEGEHHRRGIMPRGYGAKWSKYGVMEDVMRWHERIYKEMWEAWCAARLN